MIVPYREFGLSDIAIVLGQTRKEQKSNCGNGNFGSVVVFPHNMSFTKTEQ
jgi:hypothetical protein